jgi:hypothetical protein
VAEALYHAHQRGVIHRDVKPGNVLLGRDGRTRLVDFGIAHSLADAAERLTMTGTVVGTLRSMAPEQLAAGPITPRTDLYGLGVVLHEALTGEPPYRSGSPVELAEQQRAGPPDLRGLEPGLAAVVAACLAYDPADRPLHAGALASALRDWLGGDSSAALGLAAPAPVASAADTGAITQPIPVVVSGVPPPSGPGPTPAVAAVPPGDARRRWPVAALAGLAALLLVAVAIAIASGIGRNNGVIGGQPSATPTTVPSPTPTPVPTEMPGWMADALEKLTEECGEDIATEIEAQMVDLSEDAAKKLADEQVKACEEARDGEGGGNGGGGNRGGGGGGGGGGDD